MRLETVRRLSAVAPQNGDLAPPYPRFASHVPGLECCPPTGLRTGKGAGEREALKPLNLQAEPLVGSVHHRPKCGAGDWDPGGHDLAALENPGKVTTEQPWDAGRADHSERWCCWDRFLGRRRPDGCCGAFS